MVTTCLENLEMSGILTAVREMLGILLKVDVIVTEVPGNNLRESGQERFTVCCICVRMGI